MRPLIAGHRLERFDGGFDEEGHEAELHAVLLGEGFLRLSLRSFMHRAHVAFVEGGEDGRGVLRHDELRAILRRSGDIFLRVKRSILRWRRRLSLRRSRLSDRLVRRGGPILRRGQRIAFGQATAFAGAADASGIELVLLRQCGGPPAREHPRSPSCFGLRLSRGRGFVWSAGLVSGRRRGLRRCLDRRDDFADLHFLAFRGTSVSRTPAFSAVISVETLSVSRVKKRSPALTWSPDFLCQTETMPLEIDSPTAGIFTSMLMIAANDRRMRQCERCWKSETIRRAKLVITNAFTRNGEDERLLRIRAALMLGLLAFVHGERTDRRAGAGVARRRTQICAGS